MDWCAAAGAVGPVDSSELSHCWHTSLVAMQCHVKDALQLGTTRLSCPVVGATKTKRTLTSPPEFCDASKLLFSQITHHHGTRSSENRKKAKLQLTLLCIEALPAIAGFRKILGVRHADASLAVQDLEDTAGIIPVLLSSAHYKSTGFKGTVNT